MKLINLDTHCMVVENIRLASSFFNRFKGLMFTDHLPEDCGLHIRPCRGIHTFFMQYSIDVLHLDSRLQIVGIEENLAPGKVGKVFPNTMEIVELPPGTIKKTLTKVGHRLIFTNEKNENKEEC